VDRLDWDRRYAGKDLLWSTEPNRFLEAEVADLEPGRVLDLASGEGRNAIWLARRGWRVDAVDFSAVAVGRARRLAVEQGVEVSWSVDDVETRTVPSGAYELVILFYLHLPWDRMRRVLDRAVHAVAPGGTFLLVGHDRTNLERGHGGPRSPEVLYGPEDVVAEIGDLEVVEAARRRRPVDTESGTATAIDCLVRAVAPRERPA
jgi:SAM-dependent methyltransferase